MRIIIVNMAFLPAIAAGFESQLFNFSLLEPYGRYSIGRPAYRRAFVP